MHTFAPLQTHFFRQKHVQFLVKIQENSLNLHENLSFFFEIVTDFCRIFTGTAGNVHDYEKIDHDFMVLKKREKIMIS